MLIGHDERTAEQQTTALASVSDTNRSAEDSEFTAGTTVKRLSRLLRLEWLGQTFASLCWIASVFTYGVSSAGDWLQLSAASSWLLANVATLFVAEAD